MTVGPSARARALVVLVLAGSFVTMEAAGAGAASTVIAPAGNVVPALDPANGNVAVVASSAAVDDEVAVIVQNGTTKPARVETVTATATSADGGTVTRARTTTVFPQVLAPGAVSLARLRFRRTGVPANAKLRFRVETTAARSAIDANALAVNGVTLSAPLTGAVAQTLSAHVTNPSGSRTARHSVVAVMCFDEARRPATITIARVGTAKLRAGASTAASVALRTLCPTYLVAAHAA